MKQSLIFDIRISKAEDWPEGQPPSCVGARWGCPEGTVQIVKHPDCPEADLARLKWQYENNWPEE